MAEHFRFTGVGQNDEFMAVVATDRAGVGTHWDGAQTKTREGAQVRGEHLVIGMNGAFLRQVEGIGILHQELARAHGTETWTQLITELQLNVVEV
ncbi:hypothetical protein D3C80_1805500 [compost metagenome]